MIKTIKIMMSFLMFALIGGMIGKMAPSIGVSSVVAEAGYFVTVLFAGIYAVGRKRDAHVHTADVAVEMWVSYIIEWLFKNNMFLNYAYSDDAYVLNGKIVHIPQAGALAAVLKNNNSFPVASVRRNDTDISYLLNDYVTVPTHIPKIDLSQISYDKVGSVIRDHFGVLMQSVADDMLYNWVNGMPAANVIRTTGQATTFTEAGQAGNRLAMTEKELMQARLRLNKQNIPKDNRYAIIESNMLDQMVSSLSATQYRDFSREFDAKTGTVGQLYGFNIIDRSTAATIQDNTAGGVVANDFQTALAGTDNVAAVCYQQDAVARAMGETTMFQKLGDPNYYGDVFSTEIFAGGRRRRADSAGIVLISQAAA